MGHHRYLAANLRNGWALSQGKEAPAGEIWPGLKHMQRKLSKFVTVREDYFVATGGDVACAVILDIIESLSTSTGKQDSWVEISAQSIEDLTFGVIPKRGVTRKIKQLKDFGLIEVKYGYENWPSYKLNREKIGVASNSNINTAGIYEFD